MADIFEPIPHRHSNLYEQVHLTKPPVIELKEKNHLHEVSSRNIERFAYSYCHLFNLPPETRQKILETKVYTGSEEAVNKIIDAHEKIIATLFPETERKGKKYDEVDNREEGSFNGVCLPIADNRTEIYLITHNKTIESEVLNHELLHALHATPLPDNGFWMMYDHGFNLNEAVIETLRLYHEYADLNEGALPSIETLVSQVHTGASVSAYSGEVLLLLDILRNLKSTNDYKIISFVATLAADGKIGAEEKCNQLHHYVLNNITSTYPQDRLETVWAGLLDDFSNIEDILKTFDIEG